MKTNKTLALLKPAIVLTVICLVSAVLLAVVNKFTAPTIAQKEKEKQLATLSVVLPKAEGFEELKNVKAPKTVQSVYKETSGKGYALLMETETGFETLTFSIGIDAEGKIAGIKITSVFYSAGDSGKETAIKNCIDSYIGSGKDGVKDGMIISGATKSSKAMQSAIADAVSVVEGLKGGA